VNNLTLAFEARAGRDRLREAELDRFMTARSHQSTSSESVASDDAA
jgi:hypothetical protein